MCVNNLRVLANITPKRTTPALWSEQPFLEKVYDAATRLPHADRSKVRQRVATLLKRTLSFNANRKWTLSLPFSTGFLVPRLMRMLRGLVHTAATPSCGSLVIRMASSNLSVTLPKRGTIADMTLNHIKWAKRFDAAQPFVCTCGCCSSGHPSQMRAESLFPEVFSVSNKFTPVPSHQDLKRELYQAVRKLCNAMTQHGLLDANRASTYLTDKLLDRMIARCLPLGTVSKLDVLKTLKPLSKWVVMPLDKDTGSTYLMCPALYWARLNELYSTSMVNYEELSGPQAALATKLVTAVTSTDAELPAAAPCSDDIPYAYLLPKAKDPASKDRPLISYFKHPNKRKLKCVGRALMWLLKQLQSCGAVNSFSTFDTRDYASQMRGLDAFPPHTAVYLGDVKNMYTNIEHTALLEVVTWVLTLAKKHFGDNAQVFVPNTSSAKPSWSVDAPSSRLGVHVTLDTMHIVLEYDIKLSTSV